MAGCDDKYFEGKKTLSYLEEGRECDECDLRAAREHVSERKAFDQRSG